MTVTLNLANVACGAIAVFLALTSGAYVSFSMWSDVHRGLSLMIAAAAGTGALVAATGAVLL